MYDYIIYEVHKESGSLSLEMEILGFIIIIIFHFFLMNEYSNVSA